MQKLGHKNIVKLHHTFVIDGKRIAMIMEYASGGELRKYIVNKGTLSEEEARGIVQ
jgi:serine/threonine protein kinase